MAPNVARNEAGCGARQAIDQPEERGTNEGGTSL
jgi:hypothetical protein